MSEWKQGVLSDVAEIVMGQSPAGETCNLIGNGLPLLNGPTEFGIRFPNPVQFTTDPKRISEINDILFCVRGSTTGRMNWANQKYALGRGLAAIRHKRGEKYRYFVRGIIDFNLSLLLSSATGSTFPNISRDQLNELEILLPPLPEQKAIASVLSSLDDKIDLLHRQNKTLEAIAETLFRQWFIEEAQEDWEEGPLDDVISVKGGTTPSTKEPEYWDGDIHWTSPRDLSNHNSVFLFDTDRKITEKGLAQIGSGLLPIGTVLLSSRAPIGYLAITDIPVAINQGYIAIICDKSISNYFMYLWCKANMKEIKNAGNGSVFQEISKSNFKTLEIQIPSSRILDNFERAISPTFEKIKANQKQIQTLEKLRDTLLPKLMSGEVRVAS
jgi:type I restriction enzyme S subunit